MGGVEQGRNVYFWASQCIARAGTIGLKRLKANRYDPALLSEPVYSAGRYNRAEATEGEPVRPGSPLS